MLYEEIEAEMDTLQGMDLIALLPEAAVDTPEEPAATPHLQSSESAWHGYVAQTAFNLHPYTSERPTLLIQPSSMVSYTLSLPPQAMVLRFGMGLETPSPVSPDDEAAFEVRVNGEPIFSEVVDSSMASQGWHERAVDLAAWSGEDITLTLATTPTPTGTATPGWTGWGTPQVIDAQYLYLEALDPTAGATAAWRRTGLTVEDLIARGEKDRIAGYYETAWSWYKRAMRLDPLLGDPWYFAGLLRENQELWSQAEDAYLHAIASERLVQVGLSSAYYRLGSIYHLRSTVPQPERAMEAYRAALDADDFGTAGDAAWTHTRLAQLIHAFERDA
jgi:hypothetical protein